MSRAVAVVVILALFVLHQDFWWWREARPIVFGVFPIGLFYHVAYTVVTAGVFWVLVKTRWPKEP